MRCEIVDCNTGRRWSETINLWNAVEVVAVLVAVWVLFLWRW